MVLSVNNSENRASIIAPSGAMLAVGGIQEEAVTATSGVVGKAAEEWTTNAIRRVTVTAVSAHVGTARDVDVGVVVDRRCSFAAVAGQIERVAR